MVRLDWLAAFSDSTIIPLIRCVICAASDLHPFALLMSEFGCAALLDTDTALRRAGVLARPPVRVAWGAPVNTQLEVGPNLRANYH